MSACLFGPFDPSADADSDRTPAFGMCDGIARIPWLGRGVLPKKMDNTRMDG